VVNQAQAQGYTTQARANDLIAAAEDRVIAAARSHDTFAKATVAAGHAAGGMAQNVGLARHELINLSRQAQDVGVSLFSGQGLFTVAVQQGSQIADVFANSQGSVRGFFGQLATGAASALVRFAPLAAAIGTVAGGAFAANRVLDQQLAARQATTGGLGRFGGVRPEDVGAIAARAEGNGVSLNEAREGVLAFARAGVQSNAVIERGNLLALRYAATLGGTLGDAQKELAQFAAEPAKNIDALNAKTGAFTADFVENLKRVEAASGKTAAASLAFGGLGAALVKSDDASTKFARGFAYTVSQVEKGIEVVGRIASFQGPTPDSAGGQRAAEQAAAIARPGIGGAVRGETSRGRAAVSPELVAANAATAKALEDEARGLEIVRRERAATAEAIRKTTEAHQLEVAGIEATTDAQRAGVAVTQAFIAAQREGAKDEEARSAAMQAGEKVMTQVAVASRDMAAAHEANMQSITAFTQAEVEAAAANQAYVQTLIATKSESLAAAAASHAMAQAQAQDAVAARQITRAVEANIQAIKARTLAQKADAAAAQAASQHPEGSEAGAAAASGARATVEADAFAQSLKIAAQYQNQANAATLQAAVVTGQLSQAQGAYEAVMAQARAQVEAMGVAGTAFGDRILNAAQNAAAAAGNLVLAHEAASAAAKDLAYRQQEQAKALAEYTRKLEAHTLHGAGDSSGKLIVADSVITGLITQATASVLDQRNSLARQIEMARSEQSPMNTRGITDPVSSLVDSAQSKLESAQDAVKSAQESAKNAASQAMANASKSDPRMDPYLSRNASVYYGTATEQFYKEITWQQASLNAANQNLSVEQQQLQAAQQELATAQAQYTALQSIADSANRMAAQGMSPDAIGAAVAKSLAAAGFAKSAQDVSGASADYSRELNQRTLQNSLDAVNQRLTNIYLVGSGAAKIPSGFGTSTPFTPVRDLPKFADGRLSRRGQLRHRGEAGPELIAARRR
jgi:hypothetical protein